MTAANKRLSALSILVVLALIAVLVVYFANNANAEQKADDQATEASAEGDEAKETQQGQDAKEEGEEGDEKAPIPVRVTTIREGSVSAYISSTANLVAENEVKVLAEWEGRVDKLNVEEGDRIAAGQVLAALARTDGEIAVNMAKIKAETARLKYNRGHKLVDQELLSPEEFEKLVLDKEIAEQELAEAEWNLEKTLIRSPFAGRVTGRMVQLGQHVRPGDELFTVTDFDSLVARIYLPERDVLALEEGRQVRIALKADESIAVRGRIRQISPVVDTATGTVKVTIEAINPPAIVRPGAFVRVDIVRETREAALLLPKESVVRELQKAYVFVAEEDVAKKRSVTLGLEENGDIEATSGVRAGEQVIVAGQGGLKDGSTIKLIAAADDDTTENTVIAEAR